MLAFLLKFIFPPLSPSHANEHRVQPTEAERTREPHYIDGDNIFQIPLQPLKSVNTGRQGSAGRAGGIGDCSWTWMSGGTRIKRDATKSPVNRLHAPMVWMRWEVLSTASNWILSSSCAHCPHWWPSRHQWGNFEAIRGLLPFLRNTKCILLWLNLPPPPPTVHNCNYILFEAGCTSRPRIQTCLASGVETLPAQINELTLRRAVWRQLSLCVNQKCGVFGLNQFFILQSREEKKKSRRGNENVKQPNDARMLEVGVPVWQTRAHALRYVSRCFWIKQVHTSYVNTTVCCLFGHWDRLGSLWKMAL